MQDPGSKIQMREIKLIPFFVAFAISSVSIEGFVVSSKPKQPRVQSWVASDSDGSNTLADNRVQLIDEIEWQERTRQSADIPSPLRRNLIASTCVASLTSCFVPFSNAASSTPVDVETKSPFIGFAEKLLPSSQSSTTSSGDNPLDDIVWDGPKQRNLNMEQLSDAINDRLREREWFVTGKGVPELFDESFSFSDPDVSLNGYEAYCRQVRRLFDQDTARCEVICCSVTAPNTVTVLWRNSGCVNLGPLQVELKPYVVTTTLKSDPERGNLIVSQEDTFEPMGIGLLLYQFPFSRSLAGSPAAKVEELRNNCDFKTCKLK